MKLFRVSLISFLIFGLFFSCKNETSRTEESPTNPPMSMHEFIEDAVIYEVNIRQYTPEGTFDAFGKHIPRLADMGIDILWLMPIHEIGVENRKGGRGSYYSVKDYKSVNSNFGDKESFQDLVDLAHEHNMKLILDWVPNHTAWDNVWVASHEDFYKKDSLGNFHPPVPDWSDVIALNYDNMEMRDSMIDAMQYWIKELNIDGYRCDVAGMVPLDFWQQAIAELRKTKDIFMLAEAEELHLHDRAFDMQYGWHLHHIMNQVAQDKWPTDSLYAYFQKRIDKPQENVLKMLFTSNHDENTWKANAIDRMGENYKNMIALSFTAPGMPLIYSGQEAALQKELAFFEKDEITWNFENPYDAFFKKMVELKTTHPALSNHELDNLELIPLNDPKMLAYFRTTDKDTVLVLLNMGNEDIKVDLSEYLDESMSIYQGDVIDLRSIKIGANDHTILVAKSK